jgi:heme-degrading monooxygenase HmoA
VKELWRAGVGGYDGLVKGYFLIDGAGPRTLSVVVFENEAAMLANESGQLKGLVAKVGAHRISEPDLHFTEVVAEVPPGTTGEIAYARVAHVTIKPERLDEVAAGWPKDVASYRVEEGFRGALLCSVRKTGLTASVSFWRSPADTEANEKSGAFMATVDPYADMIAVPPTRSYWNVGIVV